MVDPTRPPSADPVSQAIAAAWPRVAGRVRYDTRPLAEVATPAGDVVVSSHACGALHRPRARGRGRGRRAWRCCCCRDAETCDAGPLWLAGRRWPASAAAPRGARLPRCGATARRHAPKNRLWRGVPNFAAAGWIWRRPEASMSRLVDDAGGARHRPAATHNPRPPRARAMTRAEVLAQLDAAAATSPAMIVAPAVSTESWRQLQRCHAVGRRAPSRTTSAPRGTTSSRGSPRS